MTISPDSPAFQREQEPCLLAPSLKSQPRLVAETTLERAFRRADTGRPLPCCEVLIRRIGQQAADAAQPIVLREGRKVERQNRHGVQFIER